MLSVLVWGIVRVINGEDDGGERVGEAEVEACDEELSFREGP